MQVLAGRAWRAPGASAWILLTAAVFLALAARSEVPEYYVTVGLFTVLLAAMHRTLLAWPTLVGVLILIVLLVPARRFTLIGVASFELEPYRAFVLFLAAGWVAALLADPRVRLRRTSVDKPILAIALVALASVVLNTGAIAAQVLQQEVVKSLFFLFGYLLVFFVVVSVIRTRAAVDRLLALIVVSACLVAALSVFESRTGTNVFSSLPRVFPFLQYNFLLDPTADLNQFQRGDRLRTYGSAEHPIALGAMLVMVLPLAIYLASRSRSRLWWGAPAVLGVGALATVSRTAVVMLLVVGLVFLWLRPRQTFKLWPMVVPALVVVHFLIPHTLGIIKSSFFPEGGVAALVEEQQGFEGSRRSGGRIDDLGPTVAEVSTKPFLGLGYGTRVIDGPKANARILDNQWLGTLLETGVVGVVAWVWLFVVFLRRMRSAAREARDDADGGLLFVALTASAASIALGMLLFDALGFVQIAFLTFIVMALGCVLLRLRAEAAPAT